jgi:hypothetical protein
MGVKPDDVQVGRCFVTSQNQVRKVTEITSDDRVNYVARGSSFQRGEASWGRGPIKSALPSRADFANAVDRQVTCDWDPHYPERAP